MTDIPLHSPPACLLLHGFGSTPFEMAPVAERLTAAGAACLAPLLPGHGRTVDAWRRTGFEDWAGTAETHLRAMQAEHGRVAVIGMSMGGALALRLAQRLGRDGPVGVATIATPVWLYSFFPWRMRDWRLPLTPLLARLRPVWPMPPRSEASKAIAPWQGYEGIMALEPLVSLMRGLKTVRRDLPKVRCPLLVLHSEGDKTAPADNAREIAARSGSTAKRLVMLPIMERVTGHHALTTHRETRAAVARLCLEFVLSLA